MNGAARSGPLGLAGSSVVDIMAEPSPRSAFVAALARSANPPPRFAFGTSALFESPAYSSRSTSPVRWSGEAAAADVGLKAAGGASTEIFETARRRPAVRRRLGTDTQWIIFLPGFGSRRLANRWRGLSIQRQPGRPGNAPGCAGGSPKELERKYTKGRTWRRKLEAISGCVCAISTPLGKLRTIRNLQGFRRPAGETSCLRRSQFPRATPARLRSTARRACRSASSRGDSAEGARELLGGPSGYYLPRKSTISRSGGIDRLRRGIGRAVFNCCHSCSTQPAGKELQRKKKKLILA